MASALAPLALIVIVSAGCARTAEERQLDAMRADIDRLQDERDHADRPALAREAAEPAAGARTPAPAAPPPAGASVVRVGDEYGGEDGDDYADPDDTAPRPHIRVLGTPRVGASGRYVEQVDDGEASPGAPAAAASTPLDPQAKRAYDAAMSLVGAKQYDRALDALAAFLVKWPDHPYADHAMYWRGECYFARADYAHAIEQFEGVLARFPAGAKAPDALLKLGMSHERRGETAQARDCYERLAKDYPQTDAARHVPQENRP